MRFFRGIHSYVLVQQNQIPLPWPIRQAQQEYGDRHGWHRTAVRSLCITSQAFFYFRVTALQNNFLLALWRLHCAAQFCRTLWPFTKVWYFKIRTEHTNKSVLVISYLFRHKHNTIYDAFCTINKLKLLRPLAGHTVLMTIKQTTPYAANYRLNSY
jgi:hypothetical protein